jgi:hypothetical protein
VRRFNGNMANVLHIYYCFVKKKYVELAVYLFLTFLLSRII